MRVQVGPLPSVGVDIWIAYARTVVAQMIAHPDQGDVVLDPDAVEAFDRYLDEWDDVASTQPTFVWVTEVEPERVEFLGQAFFSIATSLARAAERRGYPISPPEGEEFYQALVKAFLDALAAEGRSRLELSEQLRDDWPGLKPD
jgi:GT2 family glycosyltransferase